MPYGFDFSKSVSRFEEAIKVIRLLWESNCQSISRASSTSSIMPAFYTAPTDAVPLVHNIWVGVGLHQRSISPAAMQTAGGRSPSTPLEEYAAKLNAVRDSAARAGRDPMAITPAFFWTSLIGDEHDAELEEVFNAPLVRAYIVLQTSAEAMHNRGRMNTRWATIGAVIRTIISERADA